MKLGFAPIAGIRIQVVLDHHGSVYLVGKEISNKMETENCRIILLRYTAHIPTRLVPVVHWVVPPHRHVVLAAHPQRPSQR